jgi:hypothetical protein
MFKRIVGDIARSNGLVFIEAGPCPIVRLRGCLLHEIHSAGNVRYLRIQIVPVGEPAELIPTVAHELRHALEVLEEPWIRNRFDLELFYRSWNAGAFASNAPGSSVRSYETYAAIDAETTVRSELSAAAASAAGAR